MQELKNIEERLERVVLLVPNNRADGVKQLKADCKWLLNYVKHLLAITDKDSA